MVVDTNVFISAPLKGKFATRHGRAPCSGKPRSPQIHDHPPRFRNWLSEVLAAAELIAITERIAACRDPKDDKLGSRHRTGRIARFAARTGNTTALAQNYRRP
jgi:hypothetical protein